MTDINKLVSVCCEAKIKIQNVILKKGAYPRQICSKCKREIIEVPISPDDDLVEKIHESYRDFFSMFIVGEFSIENPFVEHGEKLRKILIMFDKKEAEIRKLLQGQPEIDKELNDIIRVLYTTEKLQLTSCDITKLANRLEAIEKLLQARQPGEELIEKIFDVGYEYGMWISDKFKAKIRKLLQSRQPERLTDNELMLEMESRGLIEVVEK